MPQVSKINKINEFPYMLGSTAFHMVAAKSQFLNKEHISNSKASYPIYKSPYTKKDNQFPILNFVHACKPFQLASRHGSPLVKMLYVWWSILKELKAHSLIWKFNLQSTKFGPFRIFVLILHTSHKGIKSASQPDIIQ